MTRGFAILGFVVAAVGAVMPPHNLPLDLLFLGLLLLNGANLAIAFSHEER